MQGERPMAADNRTLDKFHLDGIPPAPRGVPQIEVEFDIDSNGILHVEARDKATGKEHKVRIEQSSGISDEDISRMQEEAERFKEQDEAAKAVADKRNSADQVVWQAEKLLKEQEAKIEETDKSAVEAAIEEVKEVLKGEDLSAIDSKVDALNQVLQPIAQKLYQESSEPGSAPAPEAGAENSSEADDVVDADYEVKN